MSNKSSTSAPNLSASASLREVSVTQGKEVFTSRRQDAKGADNRTRQPEFRMVSPQLVFRRNAGEGAAGLSNPKSNSGGVQ
jgi:hypothetical protein